MRFHRKEQDQAKSGIPKSNVKKLLDQFVRQGYDAVGIACNITGNDDVGRLREFALEQGNFGGMVHTAIPLSTNPHCS